MLFSRLGRPLPRTVRDRIADAMARWDYSREEQRTARLVEAREPDSESRDGIPVPPPLLRVRVTGAHAERDVWVTEGARDAGLIRTLLQRNGSPIERMGAILDFGCGCGRVARHWESLQGPAIHGADVSRPSVRWCRHNLRFMRTVRCEPEPPLPYADASFDFIYALSVLTHLTEASGRRWLHELIRVLRPGGMLLFTVHGERFLGELPTEDAAAFRRGEFVVANRPAALAGTNAFASFHPSQYVRGSLLPSLDAELVEGVYEDPTGGAGLTPMPVQDNYLVRKQRPERA